MQPRPEAVQGFWTYDGKLRYKDIPRRSASEIRTLCFPDEYPPSQDQPDQEDVLAEDWEPPDVLDRKFAMAQFSHYALPFARSFTQEKMIKLLKDAVLAGKFEQVPREMLILEADLRAQYTPLKRAYDAELEQERQVDVERREEFDMKASIDQGHFIQRYFLDAEGRPDKTKMPNAITVPSSFAMDPLPWQTRNYAKKVPDLIATIEKFGALDVVFLGWTDAAIKRARDQYASKHAALQAEVAVPHEVSRQDIQEAQHASQETSHNHVPHNQVPHRQARKPEGSVVGKYKVSCPDIEDGWRTQGDFELKIFATKTPDFYVGEFNLGIVEGVMVLSTDEAQLVKYLDLAKALDNMGDRESGNTSGSSDDDSVEELGHITTTHTGNSKRKGGTSGGSQAPKRAKTSGNDPLASPPTLWLQWRGRDTGTGESELPGYAEKMGYITFSSSQELVKFSGKMEVMLFDHMAKFSGRKVSADPGERTMGWSDFSGQNGY